MLKTSCRQLVLFLNNSALNQWKSCSLHLVPIRWKTLTRIWSKMPVGADEYPSQRDLIHSSSVKSVEDVHFGFSLEQFTEDKSSLAHSSAFTPSGSLILPQAFKNELLIQGNDSTADDTSLESMEEASHKSVSKMEPEVPSLDKIKLEESGILVDSSEIHSLSIEVGKRRPYKKKLWEAFSSKSRFAKRLMNSVHYPDKPRRGIL